MPTSRHSPQIIGIANTSPSHHEYICMPNSAQNIITVSTWLNPLRFQVGSNTINEPCWGTITNMFHLSLTRFLDLMFANLITYKDLQVSMINALITGLCPYVYIYIYVEIYIYTYIWKFRYIYIYIYPGEWSLRLGHTGHCDAAGTVAVLIQAHHQLFKETLDFSILCAGTRHHGRRSFIIVTGSLGGS